MNQFDNSFDSELGTLSAIWWSRRCQRQPVNAGIYSILNFYALTDDTQ